MTLTEGVWTGGLAAETGSRYSPSSSASLSWRWRWANLRFRAWAMREAASMGSLGLASPPLAGPDGTLGWGTGCIDHDIRPAYLDPTQGHLICT